MKSLLAVLSLILMALVPMACTTGRGTPLTPPVLTPTPTATTVCGFTPVTLPSRVVSVSVPNTTLIHNLTEWNAYYSASFGLIGTPAPVPAPPVDFSTQMLLMGWTSVCPGQMINLVSVCEGPTQITADFTTQVPCVLCSVATTFGIPWAVAIPQSSLPLVVNYTAIAPCTFALTPTPTP